MDPLLISFLQNIIVTLQRIEAKISEGKSIPPASPLPLKEMEVWSPDGSKWYPKEPS